MDSLYLLIPIALFFCAVAIRLLIWAVNNGQYDDLDKEAWRILAEEPVENLTGSEDESSAFIETPSQEEVEEKQTQKND